MRLKNILEDRKLLPDNVIIAFEGIADAQRSGPEQVMLRIQFHNVGGVLNPIVEHVGDISHRMTEHAKYGDYLQGIVLDKCVKSLRILESRYGFVREMEENSFTLDISAITEPNPDQAPAATGNTQANQEPTPANSTPQPPPDPNATTIPSVCTRHQSRLPSWR